MGRILLFALLAAVCVQPVFSQNAAEKELIKIENNWNTAIRTRDIPFLEKLYATEYLYADSKGQIHSRKQDLAEIKNLRSTFTDPVLTDMRVKIYGATAVVTGLNTLKLTENGKTTTRRHRFTDVFVKRNGRWKCVATQGTAIAK